MKAANIKLQDAIGRESIWLVAPGSRGDMIRPVDDGVCDYESQTIRVYRDLDWKRKVEIAIHELLHAQRPEIDEDVISVMACEQARMLIKTGLICQPTEAS